MVHIKVYEKFKMDFPAIHKETELWFPNGLNSIRVKLKSGKQLVFTLNDNEWTQESIKEYLKRMKGDK